MAAKVKAVSASVKFPVGKKFPAKFGDGNRVNVVFTGEGGVEYTIWGDESDPILNILRRGQSVQLVEDSKGRFAVLETTELAKQIAESTLLEQSQISSGRLDDTIHEEPISPSEFTPWTSEQKKIIAQRINQNADLLAYCLKVSHEKFELAGLASGDDIRALAITLFIQAMHQNKDAK